ncbi:MAG: hypothetical protein PVF56_17215 [Desulfobacterales bacterium]|jgi:hypothetical protein
MRKYILKILVTFFFAILVINAQIMARAAGNPIIHIDPVEHTFPTVFEGEALSHKFKVMNKGTADLEIKDVTHR